AMVGGNLLVLHRSTTACWPVQKSMSLVQAVHNSMVGPSLAIPPLNISACGHASSMTENSSVISLFVIGLRLQTYRGEPAGRPSFRQRRQELRRCAALFPTAPGG